MTSFDRHLIDKVFDPVLVITRLNKQLGWKRISWGSRIAWYRKEGPVSHYAFGLRVLAPPNARPVPESSAEPPAKL